MAARISNIFIIPAATSHVLHETHTATHSPRSVADCETRCVGAGAAIAQPHSAARSTPDGSMVVGAGLTHA